MHLTRTFRRRWLPLTLPGIAGLMVAATSLAMAPTAASAAPAAKGKRWSVPYALTATVDGSDVLDAEWLAASKSERVVRRSATSGKVIWATPGRVVSRNMPWVQLQVDHTTGIVYEFERLSTSTQPYTLRLTAYSDSTGKQLWSLVPPGDAQGQLTLAADRGRALISTGAGTVAYDGSGHELWSHPLMFGQIPGGSILSGGRYYSGADVLDPNTGNVLWTWNMNYVPQMTSPTVNGNLIMFGGSEVIAWYPAGGCGQFTCQKLGSVQVSWNDQFPPVAIGNTTLAWTPSGVEAYSLVTKKLLWKDTSDSDLFAYQISNGVVWTSDSTGTVRSYKLSGCGHLVCKPTRTIHATNITALGDMFVVGHRVLIWYPGGQLVAVPFA